VEREAEGERGGEDEEAEDEAGRVSKRERVAAAPEGEAVPPVGRGVQLEQQLGHRWRHGQKSTGSRETASLALRGLLGSRTVQYTSS
jgi:hypothetical protein